MITVKELQNALAAATVGSQIRPHNGYNPGGGWIDLNLVLEILGALYNQPFDSIEPVYFRAENVWFTGDTAPFLVRLTNAKAATAEDYLSAIIARKGDDE